MLAPFWVVAGVPGLDLEHPIVVSDSRQEIRLEHPRCDASRQIGTRREIRGGIERDPVPIQNTVSLGPASDSWRESRSSSVNGQCSTRMR